LHKTLEGHDHTNGELPFHGQIDAGYQNQDIGDTGNQAGKNT
jgi:hypothetical protein